MKTGKGLLLIDIKPTTTSVTAGGQKPSLLVTADYTVEKSQVDIAGPTSSSGSVMSPFYPEGSPLYTDSTWMFTVEANKSLQLSFSSVFSLPPSSQLNITQQGGGSSDVSYTGPMPAAPSDLVINNTKGNESITVTVHLVTGSRDSAKVEITYTFLDAGYSGLLGKVPQELVVKQQVENSYAATWILTTPKTNSDGQLQRINLAVTFNKSNTTVLALRDGANAFSPFIPSPKTPYEKFSVTTNSNQLFVSYRFAGGSNTTTSSSFALTAMIDVCKSSFQCKDQSNQEICFPSVWRCDGVYHCQDGKDEKGCDATKPPPTKKPDTGKEGAPAWVVVVSILGGVVIGVIVTAIIITVVMRRRGRGYDRLNELMTPVPT
ncbi:hypothetical protein EB796_018909 [Bugula neritina]|uniref:Uncharacterized protein n=1 Tax=Bugula neritina TaxID=10212 RepID=A0A7J7J968_BUGNE|nr:hypothetical protein EB796_018909 [Bugula neritina]